MTRAIDIASVERGTGTAWRDWLDLLEGIGARRLPHTEIARRVREEGGVSGWWAQSIAVAYEQHIGRRVPGQQRGGFQVSVNKTVPGSMDAVLARWQAAMDGRKHLAGIAITRGADVSRTDKWRYWRCRLADGSRVSVASATGKAARPCSAWGMKGSIRPRRSRAGASSGGENWRGCDARRRCPEPL